MSDYTKTTDFASKDALNTGNPSKVVLGTEIDTEFENLVTAVNSKIDDVLTTRGDIITEGASGEQRLQVGNSGYILRSDGTDPAWHRPVYGLAAYRTTTQNVSSGSWTVILFPTELYDHAGAHNTATGLITLPTGYDWFRVNALVLFSTNSSAHRAIALSTTTASDGSGAFELGQYVPALSSAQTPVTIDTGWISRSEASSFYVMAYQSSASTLTASETFTKLRVEFK